MSTTTSAITSMRALANKAKTTEPEPPQDEDIVFVPPPDLQEHTDNRHAMEEGATEKPDVRSQETKSSSVVSKSKNDFEIGTPNQDQTTKKHGLLRKLKERAVPKRGIEKPSEHIPGKQVNIPKNAWIAAAVVVVLIVVWRLMSGGSGQQMAQTASTAKPDATVGQPANSIESTIDTSQDSGGQWRAMDKPKKLGDLKDPPLGDPDRSVPVPVELMSGSEREKAVTQAIISGQKVAPATVQLDATTPTTDAQKGLTAAPTLSTDAKTQPVDDVNPFKKLQISLDGIRSDITKLSDSQQTYVDRLDKLQKDFDAMKAATIPKAKPPANLGVKPDIKLKAVTVTPNCSVCRPFALIEVRGKTRQIGTGDSIDGYTASVQEGRLVLSNAKITHSYNIANDF
jgi:hypothetical protein